MSSDLISRSALRKELRKKLCPIKGSDVYFFRQLIDNAPAIKLEPNDCVLQEFGKCSYKETGCSDCKIKSNLRELRKKHEKEGNSEKAFTRAELKAWLYEIALNNCGNSLERACVELISRLDGFERFVTDKRKEANNESQEM